MRGSGPRDGFVLVSVLWAVVLIAGVCALVVNVMGLHARSAAAYGRNAAAEAAADGAIRAVAYRLAFPQDGEAIARNGVAWRCRLFEGVDARVAVQDQDGLADLNRAPPGLLDRALGGLAAAPRRALVAAILARRGADPARDAGAFTAPEDLLGLVPDTAGPAVLAALTVHSGSDGFDPGVAPAVLLTRFGAGGPPAELVRPSRARIYAITALVGEPGRGRSARRAVVELVRQPAQPFAVRAWDTLDAAEAEAALSAPATAAPAC